MSTAMPKTGYVDCARHACRDVPVVVQIARFRGQSGVEELHLVARPIECAALDVQLDWLARGGRAALEAAGVDRPVAILRRFFCSDVTSQTHTLATHPFSRRRDDHDPCAVSWVGQSPPRPAHVALWAYYINDPGGVVDKSLEADTLTLARGPLRHHWTTGITHAGTATAFDQTRGVFENYESFLRAHGLTLADNVIRTWLFVRDIDADYRELAEARRELFAQRGLTPQTHYIASTGIEGACATPDARVALDAYAIAGVRPEQIEFIAAPGRLSATHVYGVTFERATTVTYRDRKHVLISGTASIDRHGQTLYPGDLPRQLHRALDNIETLLSEAGAGAGDLSVLTAYVRDSSDEPVVRRGIRERCAGTPLVVVTGAVCRPAWLVEIEGQAIVPVSNPQMPPF